MRLLGGRGRRGLRGISRGRARCGALMRGGAGWRWRLGGGGWFGVWLAIQMQWGDGSPRQLLMVVGGRFGTVG